jgi:hypothetical protein
VTLLKVSGRRSGKLVGHGDWTVLTASVAHYLPAGKRCRFCCSICEVSIPEKCQGPYLTAIATGSAGQKILDVVPLQC